MKSPSNLFRKNRPVVSPNYIGMSTRSKKIPRRQKNFAPNPDLKPLKPSTTPIQFGPAHTPSSSSGFLYMLTLFAIVFIVVNLISYFTS